MKARSEMDITYTWDLTALFANEQEWEDSLTQIRSLVEEVAQYKGKVCSSAEQLYESLQKVDQIGILYSRVRGYASMILDTDLNDTTAKARAERAESLNTWAQGMLSFYDPELAQLEEAQFQDFLLQEPKLSVYQHKFEKMFRTKKHILSPGMEELLSKMNALGTSFMKVYRDLSGNDLQFPEITGEDGQKVVANEANYRKLMNSTNRKVREDYFKGLLSTYGSHVNTFTSTYLGAVKHNVYVAKARNYPSARAAAVGRNFIPESVYDNLVETARSGAHHLHRYIELRKRVLGLEEIHFYDLFTPIIKGSEKTYTYEEAQEMIIEALSVLGDDYVDVLRTCFRDRWLDVYPNKGKRSGAYATGAYGVHPYSLLNFTGTLDDVFTMAHELGHVMHRYYSIENQAFANANYTIFTAEVASTVNENLLLHYLLQRVTDNNEKALLLSEQLDKIRSTFFRQTFFADFEKQVHELVESDKPVTPQKLCDLYEELVRIYHGPSFVVDNELRYEWCRIPHFYMNFYVYQYATGLSAAISLANQILTEGEAAVKRYRHFLTTGGSDYSINLLKAAGVDMSSPQPILDLLSSFESNMKELEKLI